MVQEIKALRIAYRKYIDCRSILERAESDLYSAKELQNHNDEELPRLQVEVNKLREKFNAFKDAVLQILSEKPGLGLKVEKLVSIKAVNGEISVFL